MVALMNPLLTVVAAILSRGLACGPGHTASRDELAKYVDLSSFNTNYQEGQSACSAADLTCNLDSNQNCAWHNLNSNDVHWQRARLKQTLTKEQMRDITGQAQLPNGDFLATGSQAAVDASRSSTLVARLQCQRGNGKLTFDRWKSSENTDFEVCTKSVDSGLVSSCVKVPRLGENPFSYNVPESDKPFDIVMTVKGFTEAAFVAVDNINYNGDVCQCDGGSGKGGTPESCSFLNCDFEDQFCHYNSSGKGSKKGVWNRNKGNVGNPALGVRRAPNEYFANVGDTVVDKAASSSDTSTVYVLESPKFNLKQPAKLSFDLFQKAVGPKLKVCTGQNICQEQTNSIKEEWVQHTIELTPGAQTIAFIAEKLKINDFIALDNIEVEGGGNEGCVRTGRK